MGCNFHSQTCFPELQCPGPRACREVQGGHWQLFSSQRLCKIGVKATAREQKIKQALQHTSHHFPHSMARHSTGTRLMQLKSSLLITTTVTKMGRSLDIMPGPDVVINCSEACVTFTGGLLQQAPDQDNQVDETLWPYIIGSTLSLYWRCKNMFVGADAILLVHH